MSGWEIVEVGELVEQSLDRPIMTPSLAGRVLDVTARLDRLAAAFQAAGFEPDDDGPVLLGGDG